MKYDDFEINGVITQEALDLYNIQYPCKEITKSVDVELKNKYSCVKEVFIDANIISKKTIFIHNEYMVFFQGIISGKVICNNDDLEKEDIIEFKKTFEGTLPINTDNEIKAFIEETLISDTGDNSLCISLIILISAIEGEDRLDYMKSDADMDINIECDMSKDGHSNLDMEYDFNDKEREERKIHPMYKEYYEVSWK